MTSAPARPRRTARVSSEIGGSTKEPSNGPATVPAPPTMAGNRPPALAGGGAGRGRKARAGGAGGHGESARGGPEGGAPPAPRGGRAPRGEADRREGEGGGAAPEAKERGGAEGAGPAVAAEDV